MFLDALIKRNPALIEASVTLLSQGRILPDSYVIDVDSFIDNAKKLKETADKHEIKLYAMTKQIGRNPILARILVDELGYEGIVCVDFKEVRFFQKTGIKIAHVGHLVQLPEAMIDSTLSTNKPEIITVTSLEKAQSIASSAEKLGIVQDVMLKFYQDEDELYVNQESGFALHQLSSIIDKLQSMKHLRIAGITHFPCFLLKNGKPQTTNNVRTMHSAHHALNALGFDKLQLNMPSFSSCETLPEIARLQGTHAEPGHALTGTIPNNVDGSQTEQIAMLYISEVSHHFNQRSYCYGGGFYRRGNLNKALIVPRFAKRLTSSVFSKVSNDDESSIDYHLKLDDQYPIGSAVIMAFRTQIFVTRSDVVLISGCHTGQPKLIGIYDSFGNEVRDE